MPPTNAPTIDTDEDYVLSDGFVTITGTCRQGSDLTVSVDNQGVIPTVNGTHWQAMVATTEGEHAVSAQDQFGTANETINVVKPAS
jgi:hypothetical protein